MRIANELDEGNVVFIVCDDGWKYLSSGLYTTPGGRAREPGLHRLVVDAPRRCSAPARLALLGRLRAAGGAEVDAGAVLAEQLRAAQAVAAAYAGVGGRGSRANAAERVDRLEAALRDAGGTPAARAGGRRPASRPRWPPSRRALRAHVAAVGAARGRDVPRAAGGPDRRRARRSALRRSTPAARPLRDAG